MKYIILTSSIFYLLGLKFTSNIDLNSKFESDTVRFHKKEIVHKPENYKTTVTKKVEVAPKDTVIVTPSTGSDEIAAPGTYKLD